MENDTVADAQLTTTDRQSEDTVVFQATQSADYLGQRRFCGGVIVIFHLREVSRLVKERVNIVAGTVGRYIYVVVVLLDVNDLHHIVESRSYDCVAGLDDETEVSQFREQRLVETFDVVPISGFIGHAAEEAAAEVPILERQMVFEDDALDVSNDAAVET